MVCSNLIASRKTRTPRHIPPYPLEVNYASAPSAQRSRIAGISESDRITASGPDGPCQRGGPGDHRRPDAPHPGQMGAPDICLREVADHGDRLRGETPGCRDPFEESRVRFPPTHGGGDHDGIEVSLKPEAPDQPPGVIGVAGVGQQGQAIAPTLQLIQGREGIREEPPAGLLRGQERPNGFPEDRLRRPGIAQLRQGQPEGLHQGILPPVPPASVHTGGPSSARGRPRRLAPRPGFRDGSARSGRRHTSPGAGPPDPPAARSACGRDRRSTPECASLFLKPESSKR